MIVLIDNYDSFTYNLSQMVQFLCDDVLVLRNDAATVEEIRDLKPQCILLSPGPGKPMDAGICIDVIQAFSGKIPILGICLGAQAIAEAFGGQVTPAPFIRHGKRSLIFHNQKDLYCQLPLPFHAGRYHSLIMNEKSLPHDLLIQAKSEDGLVMGIRHQHHLTFGLQFHPESILTDHGMDLMKNFLELTNDRGAPC
jgi:anthranilate synthase/aminodeoxychorismate synthase-like glutamine amidotransferase